MRWRTRVHQSVSRGGGGRPACQPASHHAGLPARPRSPAKSHLTVDGMTNSSLGHMHSALVHTGGRKKNAPSSRPIATFSSSSGGSMLRTSWMWTPWRRFTALFTTEQGQYGGHRIQADGAEPSDHPLVDGWMDDDLDVHLLPFKNRRWLRWLTCQVGGSELGKRWLPLPGCWNWRHQVSGPGFKDF